MAPVVRRTTAALCLSGSLLIAAPALALANGTNDTISAVNRAAQTEGLQPATAKLEVVRAGDQVLTASNGISLAVPAGKTTAVSNGTVVNGSGRSKIVFQQVGRKNRASVQIADPNDPERYEFDVVGAALLMPGNDGSVSAIDATGKTIGMIAKPWARDRNGKTVETRYEIEGTKLIQIVKHKGIGFAYGITADPNFWDVCACAGAIAWVAGSTVIAPLKLAKLVKVMKEMGGFWEAANVALRASTKKEKLEKFGKAGMGIATEFFGIKLIHDNC
jgi:hypothetical protein